MNTEKNKKKNKDSPVRRCQWLQDCRAVRVHLVRLARSHQAEGSALAVRSAHLRNGRLRRAGTCPGLKGTQPEVITAI